MSDATLVTMRALSLAELFLQDCNPLFIAKTEFKEPKLDYFVGFAANNGSLQVCAIDVLANTRRVSQRFSLILSHRRFHRIKGSNIPFLLFIVDVKMNEIFFFWMDDLPSEPASRLKGDLRFEISLTLADDAGKRKLVSRFTAQTRGSQSGAGFGLTRSTYGATGGIMPDKRIYVERRPQGDYAIRKPNAERASDVRPTQKEAIERAREIDPGARPHVERVRNTSVGHPDKWRKV